MRHLLTAVLALVVLSACTSMSGTASPAAQPVTSEPPPPPAACLLDVAAFAAATGIDWRPDQVTASDTRCVYDPGARGPAFLAVELSRSSRPDLVTLDEVAQVCAEGSRSGEPPAFVCRLADGGLYAAQAIDGQVVTISVSAVPERTTAANLVVALDQQLGALR